MFKLAPAVLRAAFAASLLIGTAASAEITQSKSGPEDKFRQLEGESWPTRPTIAMRRAFPGHRYWQQKVDYDVRVRLDEPTRTLTGSETIRYRNNSPDALPYLRLLLDQNATRARSASCRAPCRATRSASARSGDGHVSDETTPVMLDQ